MTPRITRTGDAEIMPSPPTLLTTVMDVPTPTTLSSAQLLVARSQWIVLVPLIHMDHAITMTFTTRTGDAGSTRSARARLTMVMTVLIRTTLSNARSVAALSPWTVLVLLMFTDPVSTVLRNIRTRDADCTSIPRVQHITDMAALMLTATSSAHSQWLCSACGLCWVLGRLWRVHLRWSLKPRRLCRLCRQG